MTVFKEKFLYPLECREVPSVSISHLKVVYLPRFMELRSLDARLELTDIGALLATFHVSPVLIDKIREL